MNTLRSRIFLGLIFYATFKIFEFAIKFRPDGESSDLLYFASAATVDWFMFRVTSLFVSGDLRRDIELLCVFSMASHVVGIIFYIQYLPASHHSHLIQGINFVLAIRLIFMGGGNVLNLLDCRGLVRRAVFRRAGNMAQKAEK